MKSKIKILMGIFFMHFFLQNSKICNDISKIILKTEDEILEKERNVYEIIKDLKIKLLNENEITSFEKTFGVLDEIYFQFYRFINVIEFYFLVGNDTKLKEIINSINLKLKDWFNKEIAMNSEIYNFLLNAKNKIKESNESKKKLMEDSLKSFEISGANLSEEKKIILFQKLEKINEYCLKFSENIQNESRTVLARLEELQDLDEDFIKSLKKNDKNFYILNLDYPTSSTILKFCKNRNLRERYYKVFSERAYPINVKILNNIRSLRNEYANLLNFPTYADLDLVMTMAKDKESVKNFIEKNIDESFEKANEEKSEFLKFINENFKNEIDELKPWDSSYYFNIYEKNKLSLDNKKISEYFPLNHVLENLLNVFSSFFNLNFSLEECKNEDWCYNENLKKINVFDENEDLIGIILFDPFPREFKYSHACMTQLNPTKFNKNKEEKRIPIIAMICNFTPPINDKESLLTHKEVLTLFHEFGHSLHYVLCHKIPYFLLANDFPCDFVEIPSQLFEEWAWQSEILKLISSHFKTKEKLPDEIIKSIINSKNFMDNLFFKQIQSRYSLFSLEIFSTSKEILKIKEENFKKTVSLFNFDKNIFFECSFGHLTGYSSKYYSYSWSAYYSKKIFEYINFKNGILNKIIGDNLSKKILEIGNSKDLKIELNKYLNF